MTVRGRRKSQSRSAVKQLLYNYPEERRRLLEIVTACTAGGSYDGTGRRGNLPGDPTGRGGAALAADPEAAELEYRVGAVERGLQRLGREYPPALAAMVQELARQVYFRRALTLTGYAVRAGVSEKTARRWNKLLLNRIEEALRDRPPVRI